MLAIVLVAWLQFIFCFDAPGSGSAVIVETRKDRIDALVYTTMSTIPFLPFGWPMILHVPLEFSPTLHENSAISRLVKNGAVIIKHNFTPHGSNFTRGAYQYLLMSVAFWEHGATGMYVLVMQTDTCFCAGSDVQIEDFFSYDYVGAPWRHSVECGIGVVFHQPHAGNGGFSLRRRASMLALVRTFPYAVEGNNIAEDVYVQLHGSQLNFSYAPVNIAGKFSVESVLLHNRPLGCHQAHHLLRGNDLQIFLHACPHARVLP